MQKSTARGLGLAGASLALSLLLGASLVVAQTNSNSNANANTNTSVQAKFLRGDVDGDGVVGGPSNRSEAIAEIELVGRGLPQLRPVAAAPSWTPPCADAADVNDDGRRTVDDLLYYISYAFGNGPAPKPPFTSRGTDPTADSLTCSRYP